MTRLLLLSFGMALLAPPFPLSAQDKGAADIAALVSRLGSEKYAERDGAMRQLEKLGPPALPQLRKALGGSLEVSRRARALMTKIQDHQAQEILRTPRMVGWDIVNQSPLEVLDGLRKKWSISYFIDRGRDADRKFTLHTGEMPFWQAWQALLDAAGLVDCMFGPEDARLTPVRQWVAAGKDEVGAWLSQVPRPPWQSDLSGAVRVRLLSVPAAAGEPPACLVEICAQPALRWLQLEDVRFTSILDGKGEKVVPSDPVLDAQQAIIKKDRGDWRHLLEPGNAGAWPREGLLLPMPGPVGTAGVWKEIRGTVHGRLVVTEKETAFEDLLHADKERHATADGVQVKVLEKRLSDESVLSMRLRLDNYEDWVSEYPGHTLRKIRPGVVIFLGPGDIAAELMEVRDKRGNLLPRLSVTPSTSDDGKGLEVEVRYQAPVGGDEVYNLTLLRRRAVSAEFPFCVRDVK